MIAIGSSSRHAALALLAGSLALAACPEDGGNGTSTGPKATYVGSFAVDGDHVVGHASRVAAWAYPRLAVYHQDAADPTLLAYDGLLPEYIAFFAKAVTVNEQWIAVAGAHGLEGVVQVVRAGGPYDAVRLLRPAGWSRVDRATAWNDRLVLASGSEVRLYDIASFDAPVLLGSFDAGVASTAIVAAAGGVFVFTESGYVFVDVASGTFSPTESAALAGVESASTYGGKIRVGGRSRYAGYYRVARLDPSGAPPLAIEADSDRIVDGDAPGANVGKMTFDAERGQYLVLAETQPYSMGGSGGSCSVLRFSDGPSIAQIDTVKIDKPVYLSNPNADYRASMYANAGLLYLIANPEWSNIPIFEYQLP